MSKSSLQSDAENGNADAQFKLGAKYACGEGLKQNFENALKWWHLAADPRDPFGFVLYVPLAQAPAPITAVLVRAASDAAHLAPAVRSAFHEVDPTLRSEE